MESDSDEQAADHGAGCGKCAIIEQYQGSSQMTDSWPYHQIQDLVEPDSPVSYGVVKPGEEGDIPFVRGGDLSDGKVLQSQLRTITREVSDQYKRTLLRGGELLICLVGQPGQVGVAPPSLAGANIARQVGIVRLLEIVIPEFASYFLRSPQGQKQLGSYTGGSVQQVINLVDLRKVFVPIPPLPEQQRIVALLDEAFAGLATAKANAERNLQNARALFESQLEAVFSERGQGWDKVAIGEVAEVYDGPHATPKTIDKGPIFLGISSLQDGKINLGETRHVTPEDFRLWTRRVKPQADDVVFSYETRLGQAAVIPSGLQCCLGRRMALVRPNVNRLDSTFFVYQYISPPFRSCLEDKIVRGATVDRIPLREFPTYWIHLPSIDRQRAIASQLNAMREETQHLTHIYERKLAALEELKKSLLQQAFNGEL